MLLPNMKCGLMLESALDNTFFVFNQGLIINMNLDTLEKIEYLV